MQPKRATLTEIKLALPSLTQVERREIAQWCHIKPAAKKLDLIPLDEDDWFADAVERYAIRQGWTTRDTARLFITIVANRVANYHTTSKLARDELAKLAKAEGRTALSHLGDLVIQAMVNTFIDQRLPYHLLEALNYHEVPKLLIDEINRCFSRQPIDADRIMGGVGSIREMIDNELPGYIASGTLPMLLRR